MDHATLITFKSINQVVYIFVISRKNSLPTSPPAFKDLKASFITWESLLSKKKSLDHCVVLGSAYLHQQMPKGLLCIQCPSPSPLKFETQKGGVNVRLFRFLKCRIEKHANQELYTGWPNQNGTLKKHDYAKNEHYVSTTFFQNLLIQEQKKNYLTWPSLHWSALHNVHTCMGG